MSKFIKVAFYAVGTFLLLFSSIIVGANFVKDSGVFDKAVVQAKKQPEKEVDSDKSAKKSVAPSTKQPAKETPAAVTGVKTRLVLEVINASNKSGVAEETRGILEANGLTVSVGNSDDKQGTSRIIIRKQGVNVDLLKKLLKISSVKEELQPNSRFDGTIIIGSDFNP